MIKILNVHSYHNQKHKLFKILSIKNTTIAQSHVLLSLKIYINCTHISTLISLTYKKPSIAQSHQNARSMK